MNACVEKKMLYDCGETVPVYVVYAYRRRGLHYFCTCDKEQYEELSHIPHLFEVAKFYREH